jgi:hydroxymethylbilane synthase
MSTRGTLRLATRGSDLAHRQAASVQDALSSRRHEVELVEVATRGDQVRDELIHRLGKTGAFVRALDERVLDDDVDAAVHSMKDMPTERPEELVIAGVPERAAAGDLLLTPDGSTVDELPHGAVVGTSSLRRGAQIRRRRSDLQIEPLRGNVDTRVEKLLAPTLQREHALRLELVGEDRDPAAIAEEEGFDSERALEIAAEDRSPEEWFNALPERHRRALEREVDQEYDAIVLAEAGLDRSGLLASVAYQQLPFDEFVPAPGQGAIAVTATDPDVTQLITDAIDHPRTRVETTVERTILSTLGGGCIAPIGVRATLRGEYVHARVQVLGLGGEEAISASRELSAREHADAAADFAHDLRDRGAAELIDRAEQQADEADDDGDADTPERRVDLDSEPPEQTVDTPEGS